MKKISNGLSKIKDSFLTQKHTINKSYAQEISETQEDRKNGDIGTNDTSNKSFCDENNNVGQCFKRNILSTYELDSNFIVAGRLIIDKDKASIGMIQRGLKLGFNSAARIMDQLFDFGVIGEEEGTKPRKILMSAEQFEELVKELENNTHKFQNSTGITENHCIEEKRKPETSVSEKLKNKLNIDVDYSKDGEQIRILKNILIPLASNELQCEFINMLLKYNSPETMQLMLIDDSIINYSIYNGVPHLLVDVVTEERRITSAIEWIYSEMQYRINSFLELNVKNIDSFNDKKKKENESTFPRIICIINEANNLPYGVDSILTRLFLNSNMVGIYFILFSRYGVKSISLGTKMELLEIMETNKLMSYLGNIEISQRNIIQNSFDDMNGHDFEYFCADLLKKNGFYDVEVTQSSGDHGIDILAEKDDITYAIQCKCYTSSIGNSAIQQAHTGKSYYKKDIAVVLTNQYFTQQAIEEAKEIGVKLWDRDKLNEMLGEEK
jgi:restriction system protein